MSNPLPNSSRMLVPTVSRRAVIAVGLSAFVIMVIYWKFEALAPYTSVFNDRSRVIYPSAFTFLSILWAATLTIWGLLKSRATRYIERLADNVVFRRFVSQIERRLIYSFLVILISFSVYIADLRFGVEFDRDAAILVGWAWAYVTSVALIFDSLVTARVVLD